MNKYSNFRGVLFLQLIMCHMIIINKANILLDDVLQLCESNNIEVKKKDTCNVMENNVIHHNKPESIKEQKVVDLLEDIIDSKQDVKEHLEESKDIVKMELPGKNDELERDFVLSRVSKKACFRVISTKNNICQKACEKTIKRNFKRECDRVRSIRSTDCINRVDHREISVS